MPKVPPEVDEKNGKPIWARNDAGQPICGSNLRKKGRLCGVSRGLKDNGRCRLHWGGEKDRMLVHGRRSAALKAAGIKGFDEAILDESPTSHEENIATLDALITTIFENSKLPDANRWMDACETFAKGDLPCLDLLLKLGRDENVNRERAMARAAELLDHQRKHKVAEVKRLEVAANVMLRQDVMDLILGVYVDICDVVLDKTIQKQIGARIARRLPPTVSLPAHG